MDLGDVLLLFTCLLTLFIFFFKFVIIIFISWWRGYCLLFFD